MENKTEVIIEEVIERKQNKHYMEGFLEDK